MADLNRREYLTGAASVLGLTAGCTVNSDIEAEDIDSYDSPESPPDERNYDEIEYSVKGGLPDDIEKDLIDAERAIDTAISEDISFMDNGDRRESYLEVSYGGEDQFSEVYLYEVDIHVSSTDLDFVEALNAASTSLSSSADHLTDKAYDANRIAQGEQESAISNITVQVADTEGGYGEAIFGHPEKDQHFDIQDLVEATERSDRKIEPIVKKSLRYNTKMLF